MIQHTPPTATPLRLDAIRRTWREERPLTAFTNQLKAYLNVEHLFLGASGRMVLHTLLKTLQAAAPTRQKVLLPAYTCPALVQVIMEVGLHPLFIDISPHTFQFDITQLNDALRDDCLAVICVHPFGIALDFDEVIALARAKGVTVIEDAAQALGAKWKGQPVGTRGEFGVYSLGPGKPLSTGGGGILVTQSAVWAERLAEQWQSMAESRSSTAVLRYLLLMATFHPLGWWWAARLGARRLGGSKLGQVYRLAKLSPAQAKIGLAHLPLLDQWNTTRRRKAARWQAWLAEDARPSLHCPTIAVEAKPIFLRMPVLAKTAAQREEIYRQLWRKGIGVGRMYPQTLPDLYSGYSARSYPGARHLATCLLTLPTNHYVNRLS